MNAEYQRVTGNKLQSCLSIGDFLIIMIEDYYIDSDQWVIRLDRVELFGVLLFMIFNFLQERGKAIRFQTVMIFSVLQDLAMTYKKKNKI